MKRWWVIFVSLICIDGLAQVKFAVTSDMQFAVDQDRYQSEYYWGVCQAILPYRVDFMISTGDVCPADSTLLIIRQIFGNNFSWYPIAGNHEKELKRYQTALEQIIGRLINIKIGFSPMVYSFDIQNVHFSCLDLYQNSTDADIYDDLYDWLARDLASCTPKIKIVIGHEPAYPLPDQDCGRSQYIGSCLDEYPDHRDRFWQLLQDCGVLIYLCGHTHNLSVAKIQGVWQINAGHSRGALETGVPSTFMIFEIDTDLKITAYRDWHDGIYDYGDLVHYWHLSLSNEDTFAPEAPERVRVRRTK